MMNISISKYLIGCINCKGGEQGAGMVDGGRFKVCQHYVYATWYIDNVPLTVETIACHSS